MSERLGTSFKGERPAKPVHPRLRRAVALRLLRDEAKAMGLSQADAREWAEREVEIIMDSTKGE